MKNKFNIIALLMLSFISYEINAQSHYIVVVDRIQNNQTYKKKDFKEGRSTETDIEKPLVKRGDIITVRMVNFNELMYGFDVDWEVEKKPTTMLSSVLQASRPLISSYTNGLPDMLETMNELLNDIPARNRGVDEEKPVVAMQRRMADFLGQMTDVGKVLTIINNDEGLTLEEEKSIVNMALRKYKSEELIATFNQIKKDTEKNKNLSDEKWKILDYIIDQYDEQYITEMGEALEKTKEALLRVDFISEISFQMTQEDANEYLDKLHMTIKIYKRANSLALDGKQGAEKAREKYSWRRNEDDGDQLNQCYIVDLKVKNKYKPYFSIMANRILMPKNSFTFEPKLNQDGDSIKFASASNGGAKNAVGLCLNFDIPLLSQKLNFTGALGYSFAFWKDMLNNNKPEKKGFVITGINLGLKKFEYLNLAIGCAWGEYDQLVSRYSADQYTYNNLSDAEMSAAISKKIRPAFYYGLSINL
jgi:hypothetical protein